MPVPIAELFIAVSADVSAATSQLNRLNNQVSGTTNAFQAARPAALAMTGAAAAVGAGLATAVNAAADFDQQMASVRANLSPAEMQQFGTELDSLALKLGEQTKFSALEAAEGIEELLKAGIPAEAILGGVGQAALDLAAATGTNVANAGAIAASAMNAFGLSTAQIPGIVNTLTGVTVTTAADMDDLRLAISDVAAVAAGFGLTFEDTATSIGIFRDAGLTGNTAGTALKTMLVGLQPTAKKDIELFKQLGFITAQGNQFFDAQTGQIKDLAAVSGVLRRGLEGMTDAQRQQILVQAFGTQGFQAANILYEQGAEGVRRYTSEIRKIDAATVAAERLNSLAGDVEQLSGAFQTAQITVGRIFTPSLRQITQRATELVRAFNNLDPGVQRMAVLFIAAAAGVTFLLGSFILLAPFLVAFPAVITAVGAALVAIAPVFGVLAVAAKILAEAWERDLGGIREATQSAFGAIPGLLTALGTSLLEAHGAFENFVDAAFVQLIPHVENAITVISRLVFWFGQLAERLTPLKTQFEQVAAPLSSISLSFSDIEGVVSRLTAFVAGLAAQLSTFTGSADQFQVAMLGVRSGFLLLGVVAALIGGPATLVVGALSLISGAAILAYQNNEQFRGSVDALVASLAPLATTLQTTFQPLIDFVTTQAPVVLDFFGRLGAAIGEEFARQAQSVQPFIEAVGRLFAAVGGFLAALTGVGAEVLGRIFSDVLAPAFTRMLDALSPLLEPLRQLLNVLGPLPTLGEQLRPATETFNILAAVFERLTEALRNVVIPDWLIQMMGQAVLGPAFGQFAAGVGATAPAAPGALPPAPGGAGAVVVNVQTGDVNSEADEERLARIIAESVSRVEMPVPAGQPGLVPVIP